MRETNLGGSEVPGDPPLYVSLRNRKLSPKEVLKWGVPLNPALGSLSWRPVALHSKFLASQGCIVRLSLNKTKG